MSSHVRLRRATAVLAGTALAVGLAGGVSAPAQASPQADSASGWLAAELTNGLIYNPNFGGFNDYGLTIDTALAVDAVGGNDGVLRQIRTAMASEVDSYTTGVDFGSADVYAGATAKTLVFAQVVGADPLTYGGANLVAQTNDRIVASGPSTGRLQDGTAGTDFANVIGQAFAARGLTAAGSTLAGPATDFLLQQQCASGFFRLSFTADKSAPAQGCTEGAPDSDPDADVTSLAVLQLSAVESGNARVAAAVDRATAWLKSRQNADGSLGGGTATESANTNSTGLAGWALARQGDCVAAGRAAAWVRALQVPAGASGALAGEDGAIAYDRAGYTAGESAGITDDSADQWRRATSQAAPVLDRLLASSAVAGVPSGYQRAGTSVALTVAGAIDGIACVSGPGIDGARSLSGDLVATSVLLPPQGGPATYTVTTAAGAQQVTVQVLGKTTLKVTKKRKRLAKRDKQVIRVAGLAAGERVKVSVRGKRVDKGTANAQGRFKAAFKIIGKKLVRRGKAKVTVTGQYADLRRGKTTYKVVR